MTVNKSICKILIARGKFQKSLCDLCRVKNKQGCKNKLTLNKKEWSGKTLFLKM